MEIEIKTVYGTILADADCDNAGIYSVTLLERENLHGQMVSINDKLKKLSQRTLKRKWPLICECVMEAENG